jgi:excisionase family DNA binding protein
MDQTRPPIDRSSLMSLREAAAYVGKSSRTVRRWVACGELPGTLRLKQTLLIPRPALDAMFKPALPASDSKL